MILMSKNKKHDRRNEHGNVLIYILVAVALLGALSFAVAQSGRGNIEQLSAERARLFATEIIEYSSNLGNAVTQLKLRGCDESELNFDNPIASGYDNTSAPTDGSCNIFHPNGGSLSWQQQQAQTRNSTNENFTDYQINATNNTPDIGTFNGELYFLAETNEAVCIAINNLLAISPADPPATDTGFSQHASFTFAGSYSQVSSINAYPGEASACFEDGPSGRYYFYKVLLAR